MKSEPRVSFGQRVKDRCATLSTSIETKFPRVHRSTTSCVTYMKDVWNETFPNERKQVKSKMDDRKERARVAKEHAEKMKDMTPEEIDAYMQQIPEWKRGALVVAQTEEEQIEEQKGVFRRTKDKISRRINDTEYVRNFKESEEYERINKLRAEYQEFKGELKE